MVEEQDTLPGMGATLPGRPAAGLLTQQALTLENRGLQSLALPRARSTAGTLTLDKT